MFFSVSKKPNDDFPNHINWGDLFVDFDNGWTVSDSCITKGYNNKSCTISFKDNSIYIDTGHRQTFPIFVNNKNFVVSNLLPGEFFLGTVAVTTSDIVKTPTPRVEFKNLNLSDNDIIDRIDSTIANSILQINYTQPLKLFLTGGVDTLLLASYLIKYNIPYELVTCEHIDLDYFLCCNRSKLKKFWAYKSMHHWKEPTALLSGANGDEMMLRNPVDAYCILKHHNEDLVAECQRNNYYHTTHFLKDKNQQQYSNAPSFSSEEELKTYILNRNSADFQHWHLGNTLTITPFDNLDLNLLMLNLSYPAMRSQILDASISKDLIARNSPGVLKYLSKDKNTDNFKNLAELFDGKTQL